MQFKESAWLSVLVAVAVGLEPTRIAADAPSVTAGADVNARITDVKSGNARMGRSSTLPERGGQSALFGAVQWAWPRVV
jgi:hypothetical protein